MMAKNINKPITRLITKCHVFGLITNLCELKLPTNSDVLKYFLFLRNESKFDKLTKEPSVADISKSVAEKTEALWHKASIPCISHKRVVERIRILHDKYRNLLKPYKGRQNDPNYQSKLKIFRENSASKLFDIAACKCSTFSLCCCEKDQKVPIMERDFLLDQRTSRKMIIGSLDVVTTKQLIKRQKRKRHVSERISQGKLEEKKITNAQNRNKLLSPQEMNVSHDNDSKSSPDSEFFSASLTNASSSTPQQMRVELKNFARECDRHGISDRSAASIASAVLQDVGVIVESDTSHIIDRSKVRRERKKVRKSLQFETKELTSLYFDGRKDLTRVQERKGTKYYYKTVTQEHITLVREPGSSYLGHLSISTGSSLSIKEGIIEYCGSKGIKLNKLIAIGCDGTNVNTGALGGVIRLLELELGRSLQWFICLLHTNELPLRHLLQKLDGVTHGPKAFSGPIGKSIQACEDLPVVEFVPITTANLPHVDFEDLSTDQKYLYQICQAVLTGNCPDDLALRKPGPVVHSRWLTTAIRILRLYVATENPSENLCIISTFVMKVYAPIWFHIKNNPSCTEGSRHLWKMIAFTRYLPSDLRTLIDKVIQRNGFFGHSENILLAMLTDERYQIRELAYRRILAARKENSSSPVIRQFRVPLLNFKAQDYINLIHWQEIDRCEPPITKMVPNDKIESFLSKSSKDEPISDFPKFPCHTQATERCIRLVTEASVAVCGTDQRDGFIRAKLESRSLMKTFNTKGQFRMYN